MLSKRRRPSPISRAAKMRSMRSLFSAVPMNAMIPEKLSEAQIGALLDLFYTRVRADPELGPVFAGAIADHEWPAHIANIQDFWSAVMLRSGRYKGNPFEVHKTVAGISPELFERWLAPFDKACREVLPPEAAEAMHGRAVQLPEPLTAGLV